MNLCIEVFLKSHASDTKIQTLFQQFLRLKIYILIMTKKLD